MTHLLAKHLSVGLPLFHPSHSMKFFISNTWVSLLAAPLIPYLRVLTSKFVKEQKITSPEYCPSQNVVLIVQNSPSPYGLKLPSPPYCMALKSSLSQTPPSKKLRNVMPKLANTFSKSLLVQPIFVPTLH